MAQNGTEWTRMVQNGTVVEWYRMVQNETNRVSYPLTRCCCVSGGLFARLPCIGAGRARRAGESPPGRGGAGAL